MKFYVEPDDDYYVASWNNIPVNGIGKTPINAINDLKRKLNEVLSEKDALEKIGREIVGMILTEMDEWE